jgi:predicted ATP-grasp superfamily ATP-dependent carboligase
MVSVLLTDGLQRKTLSIVRSLGKKGIPTIVGEKIPFSPAGCSAYAKKSFVYPDPQKAPDLFCETIIRQIKRNSGAILYPMDDLTASIILERQKEFDRSCLIAFPNETSFRIAADKYETYLLATRAKVATPKALIPNTIEELRQVSNSMDYPVVIKPRKSSGSRGIRVVHHRDEIIKIYEEIHRQYPNPMLQEYIPQGSRFDVCLLYDRQHQLIASFVQKELRHFPIDIGPSTVQESVDYPELVEKSQRLLAELQWTGIVEIEYMIDPRDGLPKLMEINPRFWNSLELAIQCGVDFPNLLYKVANHQTINHDGQYELGKRTRWLIPGDILHFMTNKNRLRMDPPFISTRKYLLKDDSFLLSDPLPTVALILACVRYGLNPSAWKMMLKR